MVKKGGRVGKKGGVAVNRGPWTAEEDQKLVSYVQAQGDKKWRTLPANAGLNRCGKSCRLRWLNYLRPGIKRGNMSEDEEDLIIRLHNLIGNRWSLIAARLPGRTDNEIKNHWNTHLSKRPLTIDDLNKKLNHRSSVSTESNATNHDEEDWLPCRNTEPPSLPVELSGSEIDVDQLLDLMSMPSPHPCDVVLCSGNEFGVEDFGITGQDSNEAIFDVELCRAKDQYGCLDLQVLSSPSQFDDLEQYFMDGQELCYIFHN